VSTGAAVVALDVGGTSVKSALVGPDLAARDQRVDHVDPNGPAGEIEAGLAAIITGHLRRGGDGRVAIAFPAPFDYRGGVPRLEHKFGALFGRDLGDDLRALVMADVGPGHLDLRFVNDAEAAAIGATVGTPGYAGECVLVVMVGTGLGAALVDDHRIVRFRGGITVGELWRRPLIGGVIADDAFSARGLAAALGVPPEALPRAVEAARGHRGRPAVLRRWGTRFGAFLAGHAAVLGVDRVLVGGGGSGAFDLFGPALASELAVPVAPAPLGRDGPVVGAALLAHPEAFRPDP
jgi:glucokinase